MKRELYHCETTWSPKKVDGQYADNTQLSNNMLNRFDQLHHARLEPRTCTAARSCCLNFLH